MTTHLTLLARLKAKSGKEDGLRAEMMKMVPASRAEAGCINYDLHVDNQDPCVFWVYENWKDAAALDAHTKEPHYLALGAVKDELLAEPVQLTKLTEISTPATPRTLALK